MSLLAQFIRTYIILFLVSYLTIFTNEVHAPAAPDDLEITTQQPLKTSIGNFNGQEHHPGLEQTVERTGDFNGQEHHPGLEQIVERTDEEKETTTIKTYTSRASGCRFPPRLDYAQPRDPILGQTTFSKGSTVTYNCRPGYSRVPGIRTFVKCLEDGTWSTPGIFCQRRSCGNPGEVENAEMTADDFLFGSRVTYVCNQGYKIKTKKNYRECLADGTWSYTLPVCEAQLCSPPPDIINGYVYPLKDEYSYLDSVTYYCNRNLAHIGESSISCKEDGQWSSKAPHCKVVDCLNPYVPNAIKISGTVGPYYLNSVVRFICPRTHVLNGSDTIKCNQNSEWEPALPRCLGVCRHLPVIHFAEPVEPRGVVYFVQGSTLKFKCKKGYVPVPKANNVLTCLDTEWTPHEQFCTPISCGDPGSISNGYKTGSYFFGSGVTYACNTGYTIIGDSYIRCQEDGNWSSNIPKCQVKTCPYPDSTENTFFIPVKTQYQYLDTLTYNCSEGYQLIGKSESVCDHKGRWSPNLPSCRGICNAPPHLEYAQLDDPFLDVETFFQNYEVSYSCKKGYSRNFQYKNTSVCLGNFIWSPTEKFCSPISCGSPEELTNAVYEAKNFLFGSEAIYKCKKGYRMVSGSNTIKCLDTKKWSKLYAKCEVQTCPPPEDLENGAYSIKKKIYTYQDLVTYKCDNLTLVGVDSVSCTAEGNWTSGAPECKAVCKSPRKLKYGEPVENFSQKHYFNVSTSLKYKCRPGYIFTDNASNQITCGSDLKWSEPEVFCERRSCDNPGDIAHGQMQFEDFLFESIVTYTCKPGYTMISRKNYTICQADGTWSGTPPVCKASICDNIWELQEEARKCTSTPDEWIKYLQVQYLYLQIENIKLDIDMKKRNLSPEKKRENWARNDEN